MPEIAQIQQVASDMSRATESSKNEKQGGSVATKSQDYVGALL